MRRHYTEETDSGKPETPETPTSNSDSGRRFLSDGRGVSFTVSYVLTVAIAVLLVGGIVIAAGQTVQSQRESTVETGATVAGDQTAATVMAVDRLVRASNETNSTNVTTVLPLPETLAGQPYRVSLQAGGGGGDEATVVVETDSPAVSVETSLIVKLPVGTTTVVGGDLRVVYRANTTQLTLEGGDQ